MKPILPLAAFALLLCAACASQAPLHATTKEEAKTAQPKIAAATCSGLSAQIADRNTVEQTTAADLKKRYEKKEDDRGAGNSSVSLGVGTWSGIGGGGGTGIGMGVGQSTGQSATHSARDYDTALKNAQTSRTEWADAIKKSANSMNCNVTSEIVNLYAANPIPPNYN